MWTLQALSSPPSPKSGRRGRLVFDQLGIDVVELGHAHRRRLPHVGIGILTAPGRSSREVQGPEHSDPVVDKNWAKKGCSTSRLAALLALLWGD